MVWHLTPDQALIHRRNSGTSNKKGADRDNDNCSENPSYDSPKQNQTLCSICKSDKMVTDPESGEVICSNCGTVISDKIEDTSHLERHVFTKGGQIGEGRARTGAPTSLARHDMGLATIIGKEDRDASGQKIDSSISSAKATNMGF
jgi:TFIIB zinc-binding